MKHRTLGLLTTALAFSTGCYSSLDGSGMEAHGAPSTGSSDALARWTLVADASAVLHDPANPGRGYANPAQCERLDVAVEPDGRVCGSCVGGPGVQRSTCGGPAAGIPYFVVPELDGPVALRVVDLFGRVIVSARVHPSSCVQVPAPSTGGTCSICVDGRGLVAQNGCRAIETSRFPDPDCVEAGARSYLDQLNTTLEDHGLAAYQPDVAELVARGPIFEDEDPSAESGLMMCATYADDELEQPQGEYWDGENELRCGHLAEDSLTRVCHATAPRCDDARADYERGILAAYQAWVGGWDTWVEEQNATACEGTACPGDGGGDGSEEEPPSGSGGDEDGLECSGSPLVVSVDGAIRLTARTNSSVEFDLMGVGHPVRTSWVSQGALLAIDLDGNRRIDDGGELFGEGTRWIGRGGRASNGFAALAQYDDVDNGGDGNGAIDGGDAIFERLLLWHDGDHDGRSTPAELRRVIDSGIVAFELEPTAGPQAPRRLVAADALRLWASIRTVDGTDRDLVDVWLRFGQTENHQP